MVYARKINWDTHKLFKLELLMLENNINHIMGPHLQAWAFRWDDSLTWYQSLVDPTVTSSNLTTPILFDKNQAQGDVGLCKFQAQRAFTWGGVLQNNINHIMGPHLQA